MTFGFLKPYILVPIGLLANLPADQVETILLHELAHIRRNDYLANSVAVPDGIGLFLSTPAYAGSPRAAPGGKGSLLR